MVATGKPKFALYHPTFFWLVDNCAQGSFSETVEEAMWFDSRNEARAALSASDIGTIHDFVLCRVR